MQPTTEPSERRFVTVPLSGRAASALEPDCSRRIWEVESGTLFIALGVLLERSELEKVFLDVEQEDQRAIREDALLHDAVVLCAMPSRFAEAIEQLLETRTRNVRRRVSGSPMSELAAWWLGVREAAEGQQLAALLWSLARDRRWIVRPLVEMARGDLWIRALRLLGGPNPERAGTPGSI